MLRVLGTIFMSLAAVVVALPIVIVCSAALNGGRTMFFPPQDSTLARFGEFFISEPVLTRALTNSVIVALGAATLSVLLALPIAYRLWKTGSRASALLATFGSIPFAVPPIVFGVGLGFFWSFLGGLGTIPAGIISHAVLFLALPLVTISIGLQAIDRAHLDAAATMGATEAVTFRTIVLPRLCPTPSRGFSLRWCCRSTNSS